jgi:NitT/TauT family transport system substrate-binding protein
MGRSGFHAITRSALAIFIGLALVGVGTARSAEPVKIRVGWIVVPADLVPVIFSKSGLARHLGKSYVVEPTHFAGSTPQITALASGGLDIASLAFPALGAAIENAHLDDLRIIADQLQDGVDSHFSTEYLVLKDGPVKKPEDLKGKVLAVNTIGAGVDIAMRVFLLQHGLKATKDYTVVEARFPTMNEMLLEHKADLVTSIPPFSYVPKIKADARSLFTMKQSLGTTQIIFWAARSGFIKAHHAALVDFLEDYLHALHWFMDPAHHKEAVAIVAGFMKRPAEHLGYLFTKRDSYRDPKGLPDVGSIQRGLDAEKKLGFLKASIDVEKYTDLGPMKEAASRLK